MNSSKRPRSNTQNRFLLDLKICIKMFLNRLTIFSFFFFFQISEILCQPPVVPLNGLLIEDSAPGRHVVGSVVQFSCGEKHQLIGKPSMVCTENGTWSHPTPYCEHTFSLLSFVKCDLSSLGLGGLVALKNT